MEDPEFTWDAYLEETKSSAVPPTAFIHVEHSLENLFKIGMILEVPSSTSAEPLTFWPAKVAMTCGPLLSLSFLGDTKTFFFDVTTKEFHPLGWAAHNGHIVAPPEGLKQVIGPDVQGYLIKALWNATSIPANLVKQVQHGTNPIDQIQIDMVLEIQEALNPAQVWFVKVKKNVGGRLLLRYAGVESAEHDLWLFYLNNFLHPVGWAASQNGCIHSPPKTILSLHSEQEWKKIYGEIQKEPDPILTEILKPQSKVPLNQGFAVGMKLEVIHPKTRNEIWPATVSSLIDQRYFVLETFSGPPRMEEDNTGHTLCCHSHSTSLFPVNWAKQHGFRLRSPIVTGDGNPLLSALFDWPSYLQTTKSIPAPSFLFHLEVNNPGFQPGSKLECVHPKNPQQICVATVVRVISPILVIRLDTDCQEFLVPIDSMDLFPVGWCESNGYPLLSPLWQGRPKPPPSETSETSIVKSISGGAISLSLSSTQNGSAKNVCGNKWCPKIFFNHRCFTGPYLSKGRLAELPRAMGPGPVSMVLKEVLTKVIAIAYKPSKVLKELETSRDHAPDSSHEVHLLKAKYKNKSYQSPVEVVCRSDQVEDFCKKVCLKLECCPHLFGPFLISSECPERCHRYTKTKFTNHVYKKGYKRDAVTSFDVKRKKKKKKKHYLHLLQKSGENASNVQDKTEADSTKNQDETPEESPASSLPSESKVEGEVKAKTPLNSWTAKSYYHSRFSSASFRFNWHRQKPMHVARRVGRPPGSTKFKAALNAAREPLKVKPKVPEVQPHVAIEKVEPNPLHWSVQDVAEYIRTTDCAPLAKLLSDQEVDGQALLLMTLPVVQDFLHLQFTPAIRLCSIIEKLKLSFYVHYASPLSSV